MPGRNKLKGILHLTYIPALQITPLVQAVIRRSMQWEPPRFAAVCRNTGMDYPFRRMHGWRFAAPVEALPHAHSRLMIHNIGVVCGNQELQGLS